MDELDQLVGNQPDDELSKLVGGASPPSSVGGLRPPERGAIGALADTGIDVAKGAVGLGQSVVGVADIVTGNLAGKGLRAAGYDPEATNAFLSSGYSEARRQANLNVEQAKGFLPTVKALWDNPSAAVGAIAESLPSTLSIAGGVKTIGGKLLTSGLAKAGIAAGTPEASAFAAKLFSNPRVIAALTGVGGAAEGLQTAGSIQEQAAAKGTPWEDSALPAIAAGIGTGAIGVLSSKIPGMRDAEVALATAGLRGVRSGKGLVATGKEIAKSMFKEGALEEMPQSAQEQAFTNLALGKPWSEGVSEAAATGLVVGAGQGGGMSAASAGIDATLKVKDTAQAELLNNATPEGVQVEATENGNATITTEAGTYRTAPIKEVIQAVASSTPLEEVGKAVKRTHEILPEDPTDPTALRVKIRDTDYRYILTDEQRARMEEETAGKSLALKVGWLKRNKIVGVDESKLGGENASEATIKGRPAEVQQAAETVLPDEGLTGEVQPRTEVEQGVPEDVRAEVKPPDPVKLAAAVGKPEEIQTLTDMGTTDPTAQAEQVVVDAVKQKADLSVMARNKGKIELADKLEGQARENGRKLMDADGPVTEQFVTQALSGLPQQEETPSASVAPAASAPQGVTSEQVAATAAQVDPNLQYNGFQEDGQGGGIHLFTTQEGPAKGGTFAVQGEPTVENIQAAMAGSQQKFAQAQAKPAEQTPLEKQTAKRYAPLAKQIETAIAEDGPQSMFKRVPSQEALVAYANQKKLENPKAKADIQMISELAEMDEAEYQKLTVPAEDEALFSEARVPGKSTPQQVETDLKAFLGRGYDNLVRQNKLSVVQRFEDLMESGTALRASRGKVVGVYIPSQKRIVLVADNLEPGDAEFILRHEGAHALLREDKTFIAQRSKIFTDFSQMALKSKAVQAAFARVPKNVPREFEIEEALGYFLQEKSNHQHSIFKRVISAIKAAFFRLGIAPGKFTESDLTTIFTQGLRRLSEQEAPAGDVEGTQALFSILDNTLQDSRAKLGSALGALSNPKSTAHDLAMRFAPQWLSVTPLYTLAQTFGKKYQWIRNFAKYIDGVVYTKNDIIDTASVNHDEVISEARKAKVDIADFNTAALTASFNRMTPWEDIYTQGWVPAKVTDEERLKAAQKAWVKAGLQKATGRSYSEAYNDSVKAYNDLKTDGLKEAYQKSVDHFKALRDRERNNLLAFIEQVSAPNTTERQTLMARFDATFSSLFGAYWALSRFGEFQLEYIDSEGFRQVEHFDTPAERTAFRRQLVDQGVDEQTVKEGVRDQQTSISAAIPQQLLDQLNGIVQKKFTADIDPANDEAMQEALGRAQETANDMAQIWLRWQPESAALKNSIRRGNVKGYSTDALRSYLDYVQRHAASIAWTEQGRQVEREIQAMADDIKEKKQADEQVDTTMQGHLVNDLRARVQALKTAKTGRLASALGKLGTGYYMTSPSIALVQMSQLGVLTFPKLAVTYGGFNKAAKALTRGIALSFNKKYSREAMFDDPVVNTVAENIRATVTAENRQLPPARGKALGDRLYSDDQILKQIDALEPYQQQLLVLREAMARNLLDISATHEAYEIARGNDPQSLRNRIFDLAMQPMKQSELASRKATILATMELTEGKGFFAQMDEIAAAVNDTLHNYSREYKGAALQGGTSRVLLQFQHFRIMTGLRLGLLLHDSVRGETKKVRRAALKEFTGIMGVTGALAGTLGVPFASTMFAILGALFGDDDEPYDPQLEYSNWLKENFGETAGDVITSGLPALAGVNLTRRLGLGDLFGVQNSPPDTLHGRELAAWWAANLLGPSFSVAQGWLQGYDEIVNKGHYMRGLEAATPKPIRDALKAIRVSAEGVKTGAGKKIISDEAVGVGDIFMLALGFNPEEIAKAQQAEHSLRGISTKISERRGKLARGAAEAIVDGENFTEAMEAIQAFNAKMPLYAVGAGDIETAVRKRLMGELGTTGPRETAIAEDFGVPVYRGK